MEKQELIRLVVQKVNQKLESMGEHVSQQDILMCMGITADKGSDKPSLMILREDHGEGCHELYESKALNDKYHMVCALLDEASYDLDDIEGVILFDLTNESLSKLYNGIGDTPYTALAVKSILSGKKIYIIREEVELFKYENTAPPAYYKMLKQQLKFLTECGAKICCRDKIESVLLDDLEHQPEMMRSNEEMAVPAADTVEQKTEKTLNLMKRVITERDIIEADKEKVTCIYVKENSIITDLAKDMARKQGIQLLRK